MRAWIAFLLSMLMTAVASGAPELVYDRVTDTVVFGRDATVPWHPASLTKAMTTYTALRGVQLGLYDLDHPVTISKASLQVEPTRLNLPVGASIRLEDALIVLAVKSANDVAVAVAESLDGDVASFVDRMNEESARIGMTGSHWANPHGLHDPVQVTTARDMALLADRLLSDFPDSARIFSASGFSLAGSTVKSHNTLLGRIEGVDGLKTGYTCASGFNIVSTATRNGRSLVAVVLGRASARERDAHAAHLIEAGFDTDPSAIALDMLIDVDGPALDMRPIVCGGRSGDTDEVEAVGKDAWVSRYAAMPRSLAPPIAMSVLPRTATGIPLPRPRPEHAVRSPVPPSDDAPVAVRRF